MKNYFFHFRDLKMVAIESSQCVDNENIKNYCLTSSKTGDMMIFISKKWENPMILQKLCIFQENQCKSMKIH